MIHRVPWEAASTRPELPGARVLARLAAARPRGVPLALWIAVVVPELPCE
jgi:hypothetical protein